MATHRIGRLALILLTLFGIVGVALPTAAAAPATATSTEVADRLDAEFDLQAHRGGIGLTVENTLEVFRRALELGVTTLELDVQITQDQVAVVTHDRRVNGDKCADTAPATPGDPEWPYAGKYVHTLTLAQVKTLDCGSQTLDQYPGQQAFLPMQAADATDVTQAA